MVLKNTQTHYMIYQWDVLGAGTSFLLPDIPLTGHNYPMTDPATTTEPDLLVWEVSGYALTLNGYYDFNEFVFEDIKTWLTHFSYNKRSVGFPK